MESYIKCMYYLYEKGYNELIVTPLNIIEEMYGFSIYYKYMNMVDYLRIGLEIFKKIKG